MLVTRGPWWRCCFFQAEDGIRDGAVTGVQTCALPISIHSFQRVGQPNQPSANPPITFPPRPPAQFARIDVVADPQSRHCGLPSTNHKICFLRIMKPRLAQPSSRVSSYSGRYKIKKIKSYQCSTTVTQH